VRCASRSPAARTKEVPNAPSKTTASMASESPGLLGQAVGVGLGGGGVVGGTGGTGASVHATAPTALTPNAARKLLRAIGCMVRAAHKAGYTTSHARMSQGWPYGQRCAVYLPVPA
jgi:hypothetical protein